MTLRNLIIKIAAMCLTLLVSAQMLNAKTAYLRSYGSGGAVCAESRTSLGQPTPGKRLVEVPVGTILEGTEAGNGWYRAKWHKDGTTGLLTGFETMNADMVDPMNAAGRTFRYAKYDENASLSDGPLYTYTVTVQADNSGTQPEATVTITLCNHPGTSKEKVTTRTFYGPLLPYCIEVYRELAADGNKVATDPVRIYVHCNKRYTRGFEYVPQIAGIYLGDIFMEVADNQ